MPDYNSDTIELLRTLVQHDSVTPDDRGCQTLLGKRLEPLGFSQEWISTDQVTNLWARRGVTSPLIVFAGHTDVVPTGEPAAWSVPPFGGEIHDGLLYGRGAADMKGGVAAMMTAIERFIKTTPAHRGSVAVLLTSDEEGPAIDGTARVIERLQARGEHIDYCIVAEPSSTHEFGDTIRNGRRGSIGASLVIEGKQGHVAYPHLADNPVHRALPFLQALTAVEWDTGDAHFPPTSLQISNVHAGTGATNVIPGQLQVEFNLRYGTATSIEQIQRTITALLDAHGLSFSIEWKDSARPFITEPGTLTRVVQDAIQEHTGQQAQLDTGGGTSDGRFIAPTGAQVLEFGPLNHTIHQVDECISCTDIDTLSCIYESVLQQLLNHSQE